MTTYTETFSGQTTGSNSTTFTDRYDAETAVSVENPGIGEQDSRVLQFGTGDSGFIFQSMDAVDGDANRDNCEMLAKYRISSDADQHAVVIGRASGSGGNETCYAAEIVNNDFWIRRYVSGVLSANLVTSSTETHPSPFLISNYDNFAVERADEWHWCRFRINGTGATVTLQAKWWVDGYDEPGDWLLDTTDTSASRITAAGWCGLGKQGFEGTTYLDFFGVGTNGDTAVNVDDTQTHRVTSNYAQALTGGGGETARVTSNYAQVVTGGGGETARVTSNYAQALTGGGGETARITSVYAQVLVKAAAASTTQTVACIINT